MWVHNRAFFTYGKEGSRIVLKKYSGLLLTSVLIDSLNVYDAGPSTDPPELLLIIVVDSKMFSQARQSSELLMESIKPEYASLFSFRLEPLQRLRVSAKLPRPPIRSEAGYRQSTDLATNDTYNLSHSITKNSLLLCRFTLKGMFPLVRY